MWLFITRHGKNLIEKTIMVYDWTFPRLCNAQIRRENLLLNLPKIIKLNKVLLKINPDCPSYLSRPKNSNKGHPGQQWSSLGPNFGILSPIVTQKSPKFRQNLADFYEKIWNLPNEKSRKMNVKNNSFINSFPKHLSNKLK